MLHPQKNDCRTFITLDGIWRCTPDPGGKGIDKRWYNGLLQDRPIAVPGSWNEQYRDLFDYFGVLWYEREIFIGSELSGKRLLLRIGSACNSSRVWINSVEAGGGWTAHLPLELDVSDLVEIGKENRITIRVDATLDPWGLPPAVLDAGEAREGFFNSNPPVSYDFYPYGGIHRSVKLLALPSVTIDNMVITSELKKGSARISCTIGLCKPFQGEVILELLDTNVTPLRIPIDGTSTTASLTLDQPELWDIDNPYLYRLGADLISPTGELVDRVSERFGVRTIEIRGSRLLLNNHEIFLKGFGKHEDFFISGRAYNPAVMIKDFDLLGWTGANSFRTSHYPYAEEVLDQADELGILVIGETPFVSLNERLYTPEKSIEAGDLLRRMIRRDRNHPSLIIWSVANEPNIESDAGDNFFRRLIATVREEDPTRPVTYVAHREPEDNPPLAEADLVCINKYFGWYEAPGDLERADELLRSCLDRYYNAFGKPVLMAEFGADAVAGTHAEPPLMFSEEFQSEMIRRQYKVLREKEWVIGAHLWAFADFRTAMSISRVIVNRKGVFTRDREPKLAAHTIRKLWSSVKGGNL